MYIILSQKQKMKVLLGQLRVKITSYFWVHTSSRLPFMAIGKSSLLAKRCILFHLTVSEHEQDSVILEDWWEKQASCWFKTVYFPLKVFNQSSRFSTICFISFCVLTRYLSLLRGLASKSILSYRYELHIFLVVSETIEKHWVFLNPLNE